MDGSMYDDAWKGLALIGGLLFLFGGAVVGVCWVLFG